MTGLLPNQSAVEDGGIKPPIRQLEPVICVTTERHDKLNENVIASFDRNLPRLINMETTENPVIAIVGGGPSLNDTLDELKDFGTIMVCGSAHDHLVKSGIKPHMAVICDPDPEHIRSFRENPEGCKYLIASRCNPNMFDHLEGRDLRLWHMYEPQMDTTIWRHEPAVICGCTVMLSAIPLAIGLGFKEFHFFGFDSSFPTFEKNHAYDEPETSQVMEVQLGIPGHIGERKYLTTATWVAQAQQYKDMRENWKGLFKPIIHGDGLIAGIERLGRMEL